MQRPAPERCSKRCREFVQVCLKGVPLPAGLLLHSALAARWCIYPAAALRAGGSLAAAVAMTGGFFGWSLMVLVADIGAVLFFPLGHNRIDPASFGSRQLAAVLLWASAYSSALPLLLASLNRPGSVSKLLGAILAFVACNACFVQPKGIYCSWLISEAIVSLVASQGVSWLLGTMTFNAERTGPDEDWLWLRWRLRLCGLLSWLGLFAALLVLGHVRGWKEEEEEARAEPPSMMELPSVVGTERPSADAEMALDGAARGEEDGEVAVRTPSMERQSMDATQPSISSAMAVEAGGSTEAASGAPRRLAPADLGCSSSTRCLGLLGIGCSLYALLLATGLVSFLWMRGQAWSEVVQESTAPPHCDGCYCAPSFGEEEIERERGVVFSTAFDQREGRLVELRLDVYRSPRLANGPAAGRSPAAVLVHGGGFWSGSRNTSVLGQEAINLARHGFVVFMPDYRLIAPRTKPRFPQVAAVTNAVNDTLTALHWVLARAEAYGLDTKRLALWGSSAGAVTCASLVFLSASKVAPYDGVNVTAAVGLSGSIWPFVVRRDLGHGAAVPWLNVHGDKDGVVPFFLAATTHTYLRSLGMGRSSNRLLVIPGGAHVPWNKSASGTIPERDVLRPHIQAFLVRWLSLADHPCPSNRASRAAADPEQREFRRMEG